MRHLILVLGDQLDASSQAFRDLDRSRDAVWMAEVEEESTHVWCHKSRIVFFLSAMRHFRDRIRMDGTRVHYHALQKSRENERGREFHSLLLQDLQRLRPEKCIVVQPGDHRVLRSLSRAAQQAGVPLEVRADDHFLCSLEEFSTFASGKKKLILEHFYRTMRRKLGVLMTEDQKPVGGQWNFDRDNRSPLRAEQIEAVPPLESFSPDETTRDVMRLVEHRFADHPGSLARFSLPVTREEALSLRDGFMAHRLAHFGTYQDSMWIGEPFLYHSRLSAALNVKLLRRQEVLEPALSAWRNRQAPLNSVEGFVRQIIGWREYVRGVYWLHMPGYQDMNHLDHRLDLPRFYWNGETDMACLRDCMEQVLEHAYSHHIQRLMVLGLFALLLGVHPLRFHEWHMAMYADAVDWVSLPNTLGMSQYGDGGIVGTKPYCASGAYIQRMSNYCAPCRYDPHESLGSTACPFTVLYWDFLDRNEPLLQANPRMRMQLRNLRSKRQNKGDFPALKALADRLRRGGMPS